MYIYIYIYIWSPPPPPPTTDPGIALPVCPGRGRKTNTPKLLEFPKMPKPKKPKTQPKFRIFGNSSGSLKIQKPSKFLDFPKFQNFQPKFRIFGNSSGSLKIQKASKFLEFPKFQKSKNSNPSFGFLETRAGASKSKNRANSSSFQNSKPWGDFFGFLEFWKLEEFARFLDLEAPARVSKIPKIQKCQPKVRIFGNSNGSLKIQKSSKFLEFPKFQTLGWVFLGFCLETRGICSIF